VQRQPPRDDHAIADVGRLAGLGLEIMIQRDQAGGRQMGLDLAAHAVGIAPHQERQARRDAPQRVGEAPDAVGVIFEHEEHASASAG
jgi:hypothetical protein